ncbi:MAG: thermonuclease family protein [Alphaproteobacteria bacterium]|nr:thermonuclease family protein [Alphaproteobacteria bacterium]
MKKYVLAFLLGFVCLQVQATPVIVEKIVDGDTFIGNIILADGIEVLSVSVRLRNVDTPEIHGECEDEIKKALYAKQRLGELVPEGSTIEIKNIKNDKYPGRIDADVFDSAGRDVGLVLVKEKVGRSYSGGKRQSWCNLN